MKVSTERFGELEVKEEDIISFPKGILGFEDKKAFALINVEGQENTFFFLQSLEDEQLCFFMLHTFTLFPDYQIELDETTIEQLQLEKSEDAMILTVITARNSLQEATTNLQAPVIINTSKRIGKQIISDKGDHLIRQPVFSQDKEAETQAQRR